MIDSSLILQQIQTEQIPDTWHVIRPRNQARFLTYLSAIIFGLLFNFCALAFGSIILANTGNQQLGNNPLDLYIHDPFLAIVAHLVAIGLTLWLTLLLRLHAINLQEAVLVLLPEGIFHCKRSSDGNKRNIQWIKYKDIQKMVLKVSKSGEIIVPIEIKVAAFDLNALDPNSLRENKSVPQIFGRFEFQFHLTNGMRTTWFPPQVYEREIYEIAQWVLTDYRAFTVKEISKQQNHF